MKSGRWSSLTVVTVMTVLGAGSGCISSHETVYEDPPRERVEFENEAAGRMFYERLSRMASTQTTESKTAVSIPVVLDVSKTRKRSYNTAFNEAVLRCDTNQDGVISEVEARIFTEQP